MSHQKRTTTTTTTGAGNTMSKTISFSDDPDSFIIGDRVWVQGTKPGYIVYIGDVQFAKGEWAGVVLDHPEGKNDGSVYGVRYFQCPPNRGLFTRLHRLSRYPADINNNSIISPSPPPKIADDVKPNIAQPNIHHHQPQPQQNIRTHRVYTTDGNKITTTVTRVTKTPANVPHYALPIKPTQVITTVTTTTTTVEKPKSVLKSSCRVTSSQNTNSADKLRSPSTNPVHHVHF